MRERICQKLVEIFGRENVSTEKTEDYAADKWPRMLFPGEKGKVAKKVIAVVFPIASQQISELLKYCSQERIPVVPCGGASGVCGALMPRREAIIINLQKMNRILDINDKNLTATIEAGIFGDALEKELEKAGCSLRHFPASLAVSTLGGWLATRGSGAMSAKYGKIEDMVLNLEVVLPDGTILTGPEGPIPFPGPRVLQVFVGSEGTLGIITKATLKINPLPKLQIFRSYGFPNMEAGAEALRKMLRLGIKPSAYTLYDGVDAFFAGPKAKGTAAGESDRDGKQLLKKAMTMIEDKAMENPGLINFFAHKLFQKPLLVMVFEGSDETLVYREASLCERTCFEEGAEERGEELAKTWYEERYKLSYDKLENIFSRGGFADTIEVCATWDKVIPVYRAVKKAVSPLAMTFAHLSHLYHQGCGIYFTFAGKRDAEEKNREFYQKCWEGALRATIEAGGIVSHHHGVGVAKLSAWLEQFGQQIEVLKALKRIFDPNNILNPGKLGV